MLENDLFHSEHNVWVTSCISAATFKKEGAWTNITANHSFGVYISARCMKDCRDGYWPQGSKMYDRAVSPRALTLTGFSLFLFLNFYLKISWDFFKKYLN